MAVPDNSYPLAGTGVYFEQDGKRVIVGTGVYFEQDGKRMVVGTTGEIILGSTDGIVQTSTGITVGTSGTVHFSSGSRQTHAVVASTTTANLAAGGISTVAATTAAGAQVFTLNAPVTGIRKTIICTVANATDTCTVDANGVGVSNDTTVTADLIRFIAPGSIELVGLSTARWGILTPNVTTVQFVTS